MNPTYRSAILRRTVPLVTALWVAAMSLGFSDANATPVTTYNTGELNTIQGATDSNYKLVAAPVGSGVLINSQAAVALNPLPSVWLPQSASLLSAWVNPQRPGAANLPIPATAVGQYVYETTFDLTNFNINTANFAGKWLLDDPSINPLFSFIELNGVPLTLGAPNATSIGTYAIPTNYALWANFSFGALAPVNGLLPNLNTLRFGVQNGFGPTGLRVEYEGDAQVLPEPSSLALVGAAFVALGLRCRGQRGKDSVQAEPGLAV